MPNPPTLMLTGATGYLGSRLLAAFVEHGYPVVILKRKSSDLSRIEGVIGRLKAVYDLEEDGIARAFREHEVDVVVHSATDYGRKHKDSLQIIHANLILPLTLLKVGKPAGLKMFLNTDTLLDKRVSEYSLSKRQFYDWLNLASSELVTVNVALEHFFGPHDDSSKFVSWIIDRILSGEASLPLTPGEQKRDFIYIDDVVDAFVRILERSRTSEIGFHEYEVGSGLTTSIRDLVTKIGTLCEPHATKLEFGKLPYRANEVMESKVNLEPLRALGWAPKVALAEGLKRTIDLERKKRKSNA